MPSFKEHGDRLGLDLQRSFVLGERSLRAYLAGGNVRFLEDAEMSFSSVPTGDRRYDEAQFYLGITKTQLRKTDESIQILEELRARHSRRGSKVEAAREDKIGLQLAFAYIKTYTNDGYQKAEQELDIVKRHATEQNDGDLERQTQAIQAFLYSVMAGRFTPEERRSEYANAALQVGKKLLEVSPFSPEIRFEALNALGITWMRIAENRWNIEPSVDAWSASESYYDQALDIVPSSVRVLQNLAALRMIQVVEGFPGDEIQLLNEAEEFCVRSLEVNDQDQYPFLELAKIRTAKGDPNHALDAIHEGRTRPGAVKSEEWERVESVAKRLAATSRPSRESPQGILRELQKKNE